MTISLTVAYLTYICEPSKDASCGACTLLTVLYIVRVPLVQKVSSDSNSFSYQSKNFNLWNRSGIRTQSFTLNHFITVHVSTHLYKGYISDVNFKGRTNSSWSKLAFVWEKCCQVYKENLLWVKSVCVGCSVVFFFNVLSEDWRTN